MHSSTKRGSRNRIVLVVVLVLVLVIEPRHPIEDEDENEDDEEKFARRAKILRDSSTVVRIYALENRVVCEQGYMISLAGVALPDI